MSESRHVLVVISEDEGRDPLLRALSARGAHLHTFRDAMKALAKLGDIYPEAVVVGRDPGPPGAASLCRILSRKRPSARLYRLADPSEREVLESRAAPLSPALSAEDLAARILPALPGDPEHGLELSELSLGPLQLVRVLMACADGHYSGRLWVATEDAEREVVLLSGLPVATRSTVPGERLGQVAVELGLLEADALHEALSLCRVRGLRLGEALLRNRALSGYGLHRALCEQNMRRLSALASAGPCTVRYVEETQVADRETLLRVHPMTAMLRALSAIPQVARAAAFQHLAELRIEKSRSSRSVDRFMLSLGIHDLEGLLHHARTLGGLKKLLSPALSLSEQISAELLCWVLMWSGAFRLIGAAATPRAEGMHETLRGIAELSPFEAAGLWTASAAAADDLPEGLSDYLFAATSREHQRGQFALLGPEVEGTAQLSAFLAQYYRIKGSVDPLHVLGLHGEPEADLIRHAYFDAAAALDSLPDAADPLALSAKRNELRSRLNWAYLRLGAPSGHPQGGEASAQRDDDSEGAPAHPSAAGASRARSDQDATEPAIALPSLAEEAALSLATMDVGLLKEAEQYAVQGRWQDVVNSLVTRYRDLEAMPLPAQLLYAVAMREAQADGAAAAQGPSPEQLSIGAFARMLGVSQDSPTATLLAKRILRRRPDSWNRRPSPRLSLLATSLALVAGAAVGLWLQNNSDWSQRVLRALVW